MQRKDDLLSLARTHLLWFFWIPLNYAKMPFDDKNDSRFFGDFVVFYWIPFLVFFILVILAIPFLISPRMLLLWFFEFYLIGLLTDVLTYLYPPKAFKYSTAQTIWLYIILRWIAVMVYGFSWGVMVKTLVLLILKAV